MPIAAHLEELRRRLFWAITATLGAALGLAVGWHRLLQWALMPLDWATLGHHGAPSLLTLTPTEPFFTVVNVVLAAAVMLASPLWMYQAWAFLAPALPYPHRGWMARYLALALLAFWVGVGFAYALVIPASLHFLLTFSGSLFHEAIRAGAYLGFITTFSLVMGLVFTIPVWLAVAVKMGWLTPAQLRRSRRPAAFASAVLAAAVVPSQDPLTLLAAVVPLYGLYEGTVQVSRWIRPVGAPQRATDPPGR